MTAAPDVSAALRAAGRRLTGPRRRILAALAELEHATPDAVADHVAADGGARLAPSTIYRNFDALQDLGLVSHTHLDHRAPTYHLAEHAGHLHLLCLRCGGMTTAPAAAAASLVRTLAEEADFVADVTHLALYGRCAACRSLS